MKLNVLLPFVMMFCIYTPAIAQESTTSPEKIFKPFKVDVMVGYALPKGAGGEGIKGGVAISLEPKFNVIDALAIGLRLETAAMTTRLNEDQFGDITGDVSAKASGLLTAEYYFSNKKFRPFAGGGAGAFTLAEADVQTTNADDIEAETKFGGMLRAGFMLSHFRLAVEYNIIPDTDLYVDNSYLAAKIGVTIGGGRRSR